MTDLLAAIEAEAEPGESPFIVLPGVTLRDLGRLSRGMRKRRSVPIMGYNGLNGQGKSLSCARDTIPTLLMGRRVLSTMAFLDPHSGNPHPMYEPFRSWSQLHDFENGDLVLDEVTGILDSRDGASVQKHVRRMLPQMRRRNVLIRWTAIDWDNSDRRLRQITQAVAMCKGYLQNHSVQRRGGAPDALPMWAPNRAFSVVTYDAQTLSQSNDSKQLTQDEAPGQTRARRAKVKNREWYFGARSGAFAWYDTLAPVSSVDGNCPICGLREREAFCKGHEGGFR